MEQHLSLQRVDESCYYAKARRKSQAKCQHASFYLPLYENKISIANSLDGTLRKGDDQSRRAAKLPLPLDAAEGSHSAWGVEHSTRTPAPPPLREPSAAPGHLPRHRPGPPVRFPGGPVQATSPNNAEKLQAF